MWVCLPRNPYAVKQLKLYQNVCNFQFTARRGKIAGYLQWRNGPDAESILVRSPLSKYLSLQRSDNPGGEWRVDLGRIVCKDYAILARFSDTRQRRSMVAGTLKDYFLAGIRGLGTWGAAWFLDRKYSTFSGVDEDEPIQLLLEVTYQNENIVEVRDVSAEPRSYFEQQNREASIRKMIKDAQ